MTAAPLRLSILISGRGSNMAAIAAACSAGLHAQIVSVIADRAAAPGLALAQARGIATSTVVAKEFADRTQFEARLAVEIDASRPDLVVLAGFMRILGAPFVARYAGRMLNVHPSLLPNHKGLHTHQRVLDAGDGWHGCSIHYVTDDLDGGPVVAQGRLRVQPGEDEAALSARVQRIEHILYPRVVGWIAQERLAWHDGTPWFDGAPLAAPVMEDFA